MHDVAIVTPDVVGRRMAGPGIRALHFARELGKSFRTVLSAKLEDFESSGEPFDVARRGSMESIRATRDAAVVIGQPSRELLGLRRGRRRLVFDLFDPVVLELAELDRGNRFLQSVHRRREWGRLLYAIEHGDLLIAATDRQCDFYTGVAAAMSARNVPTADRWVTIPFGVDPAPPEEGPIDLPSGGPIILWGGGTWPWLDAELAIDAVGDLVVKQVDCRLVFLGTSRPNSDVGGLERTEELKRRSASHGDRVVWNEGWVPYHERGAWLKRAAVTLMLHRRTAESEYSIRTRLFDAMWAAVPVVCSRGGFASELVEREGLGVIVEPGDRAAVVRALERILGDDEFRAETVSNLERVRSSFHWDAVTRPLVERLREWIAR